MKNRIWIALLSLCVLCALVACSAPTSPDTQAELTAPVSPRPVLCAAEGELCEKSAQATRYLASAQPVEDYIYEGLVAELSDIDVSAYQIPKEQITALYTDVMNSHPDLFFVQSGISYTYSSAGYIVSIKPKYWLTGEELVAARAQCEQALDEICAGVDPTWSDFEIALYLHDYLCLYFSYDTDYEIYDMYQFLTKGEGVCQAYTLTYMELLSRYGISSDVAVSEGMNHIWNVITLGGNPYHVDVTWDDPVPNTEGYAGHSNFLRSDAGIASTGHYGWVSDLTCTSDAYETTFVVGVEQPFAYTAGEWLYADGASRAVLAADFSTMSTQSLLAIEDKWLAPSGNAYYVDAFFGVGTYRGNVIYNTPSKILAYSLQSGVTVEIGATVPVGKQIFGLWVMGDTVYYRVSDEPNGEMQVLSVSVTGLADYLSGDADQNGVVDGRDVTAIRRYLEGLPTVCHTGAADLDDSGSVDARDVEILRQYLVENN